jgi:hypothetical protein
MDTETAGTEETKETQGIPRVKLGFFATIVGAIQALSRYKERYEALNKIYWELVTNSAKTISELETKVRLQKEAFEREEKTEEYKLIRAIRGHRWKYNGGEPWTQQAAEAWRKFLSSPTGKALDESMHNFALERAQDAAHCGDVNSMKIAQGIVIGWFTARHFAAVGVSAENEDTNGDGGSLSAGSFPSKNRE